MSVEKIVCTCTLWVEYDLGSAPQRERDKWFEDRDDGMIPGELSMVVEVRSWVIRDVLRSQVMRLTVLRFLTWSDGLYHGD